MLEIADYHVRVAGREMVRGLSLQVAPGQVAVILGPNGAGKSTALKGLCGLLPARGRARIDGQDLLAAAPAARARMVGYVAQDLAHLSVRLTVFELLLLSQNGARRSWRRAAESEARAEAVLSLLGLERFAGMEPRRMSGGERQMVGLAAALVRRPRLLLLDEPTAALDLANQLRMLDAVRDYTRREEIVTLAILHDLNLATRYGDSALFLRRGEAIGAGPVATAVTPVRLAELYGVECRILPIEEGRFQAVYPLKLHAGV